MKELILNLEKVSKFSPKGTKRCESICERECIDLVNGYAVVCHGCNRIVMEDNLEDNLSLLNLLKEKNKLLSESETETTISKLIELDSRINGILK